MVEPLSADLRQRLETCCHCRPRDFRRARRLVQRLARDLPAFDSVWLDALVQLGRLTPYQARILESGTPAALQVEQVVLLDEIGHAANSTTFLGRGVQDGELCVVKHVRPPADQLATLITASRQLASAGTSPRHRDVVAPHRVWEHAGSCYFQSQFVGGLPLNELLVRRGRFPQQIVGELARQLAIALGTWHAHGWAHGDVRLAHIRIDDRGQAVLVEAGVRTIVEPEMTLHAHLSLEAYDGVAPERIGIGQPPTPQSDWYALGCVLWQLLAGRPPYAMADPLAKLAAHQARTVPDVREWAPETAPALAELIASLTRRDPALRPRSAEEIVAAIGSLRLPGRAGVRRFRQHFDRAVPHLRQLNQEARRPMPWALGMATVVAGMVWLGVDSGSRHKLLSIGEEWLPRTQQANEAPTAAPTIDAASGLLPLPAPTADGVVWLTESGPYAAGDLQFYGTLQLRAAAGVCPEILVRDRPLRVNAAALVMEHVRLRYDVLWPGQAPAALATVRSQQVTLKGCAYELGERPSPRDERVWPAAISWSLVEPFDPAAGQCAISDCVFRGAGPGMRSEGAARRVSAHNVLSQGRAALFELQPASESASVRIELSHVTLRDSDALVRCVSGDGTAPPSLQMVTTDCVFGLRDDAAGLVEYRGAFAPSLGPNQLTWQGESSLLTLETPVAGWREAAMEPSPVSTDHLAIEGLIAGQFTFAGPPTMTLGDSVLGHAEIPRRSLEPPGIVLNQFPTCVGGTVPAAELSLELPALQ